MRNINKIVFSSLLLILLSIIPEVSAEQVPAGPQDPVEMEAFFDRYLLEQMAVHHVAGAAVSVVKDGRILFTKGYGYADVAGRKPIDPDKTVFILASLTKLFTWTAVMQLVEQGKLDLDADINTYLDFKIPATYAEPITLNHLMAHAAGFEDRKFGQMAARPEQLIPLGDWLKTHIPARIRKPGQYSAYANYGAALAGYIVERVSGLSYDEYVEKNILVPLGMHHTTSRQPLPADLRADSAPGYRFVKSAYQPQPFVFEAVLHPAPAGSIRASAGDMARFMIAHLEQGRYGQAGILQPATVLEMHRRNFSHDPRVNGMAHGFWELDMNGRRIIGHAGSHFIFNSFLMLFPEERLGVFIATNTQGGGAFISENYFQFREAFVNHYFPQAAAPAAAVPDFEKTGSRFNGSYAFTYGQTATAPEKLFGLVMAAHIKADSKGLNMRLPFGTERFVATAPLVFRQQNGNDLLVFHEDKSGRIMEAFYGPAPLTALVKNSWYANPKLHLLLLAFCALMFLSRLIAAPVAFFLRRRRKDYQPAAFPVRAGRWTVGASSLLGLLLLYGIFASLLDFMGLFTGRLPLWKFVPPVVIGFVLLAMGTVYYAAAAWKQRAGRLSGRIFLALTALAATGFAGFLVYWNIAGVHP